MTTDPSPPGMNGGRALEVPERVIRVYLRTSAHPHDHADRRPRRSLPAVAHAPDRHLAADRSGPGRGTRPTRGVVPAPWGITRDRSARRGIARACRGRGYRVAHCVCPRQPNQRPRDGASQVRRRRGERPRTVGFPGERLPRRGEGARGPRERRWGWARGRCRRRLATLGGQRPLDHHRHREPSP